MFDVSTVTYSRATIISPHDIYRSVVIPEGYEAIDFRPPKKDEWFLRKGEPSKAYWDWDSTEPRIILRAIDPDEKDFKEAYPDLDRATVKMPEGSKYVLTGEFRVPTNVELYLQACSNAVSNKNILGVGVWGVPAQSIGHGKRLIAKLRNPRQDTYTQTYEVVETRPVTYGEFYLDSNNRVYMWTLHYPSVMPRPILTLSRNAIKTPRV